MMATDNEPMSEERLAAIKVRIDELSSLSTSDPVESYEMYAMGMDLLELVHHLRAKVERLRSGRAKVTEAYNHLEDENVAMREIVEKLVSLWIETDDTRPARRTSLFSRDGLVDVEALREQARALLDVEASNGK